MTGERAPGVFSAFFCNLSNPLLLVGLEAKTSFAKGKNHDPRKRLSAMWQASV
jgi:hypothetical protein